MNHHGQIINIQMPQDDQIRATIEAEDVGEYAAVLGYKYGHRDARRRAAQIAAQADARIAELERWIMEEQHRGDTFQGECHNLRAQLEAATDALQAQPAKDGNQVTVEARYPRRQLVVEGGAGKTENTKQSRREK